ncbi:hypothetical protein GS485_11280 [Rhodococcus hoagii]|nr:hypothetical protein [Prescottella equi]
MKIVVAAICLVAAGIAGCSSGGGGAPDRPALSPASESDGTGTFTLMVKIAPHLTATTGSGCEGNFFMSEMKGGAYVSVADSKGEKIGASNLGAGSLDADGACVFYAYPKVRVGSDFYDISIAAGPAITRSAEDAHRKGVGMGYGY